MRFFLRPDGRTYAILPPGTDLLGDVIVTTIHGSQNSKRGGVKNYVADSFPAANKLASKIARIRIRHGYIEQRKIPAAE